MPNTPQDFLGLLTFLIYTLPGFFLLKGYKKKFENDFEHLMLSFFWGMVFFSFFSNMHGEEAPTFVKSILEQPFAAAIALSVFALIAGWIARKAVDRIPRVWSVLKSLINRLKLLS